MLAESQSLVDTVGRWLVVASWGSYDKAGTWEWGGPYGPSGRITLGLTPRHKHAHPPPAAHQLGRADKNETVTREGIGITFL